MLSALFVLPAISVFASELDGGWKGIKVFESTRSDVEKLLGRSTNEINGEVLYETGDANIRVLFSKGPCVLPATVSGGYNVSEGTVLQYYVVPTKIVSVGDLGIDQVTWKRFEDAEALQFSHYSNSRLGIFLTAVKSQTLIKRSSKQFFSNALNNKSQNSNANADIRHRSELRSL